jgi:hypothetical protein
MKRLIGRSSLLLRRAWRSLAAGIARTGKAVWQFLEATLGDDTHWKVVRRLLSIVMTILLGVAVRYGWLANLKLDWLASLFGPLLGEQYPWSVQP